MENNIFKYLNQNFSPSLLPRFECNFTEAYYQILKTHPNAIVLSVFENNQEVHRSIHELHSDVTKAMGLINANAERFPIICTIGYNTYLHIVFILATLLSKKTLFLLNPNETDNYFQNQIQHFNSDYFIFHDDRVDCKLRQSQNFSLHCQIESKIANMTEWSNEFIYVNTSGSTGYSKIVRQSESAVMTNVAALSEVHELTVGTKIATCMPLFHVNALEFALLCSILNGCHLLLFEETNQAQMPKKIHEVGADIVSVNPQMLKVLAKNPKLISYYMQSIKYFVSAASALTTTIAKTVWMQSRKKIIQGYGLSEAVNFSCLIPPDISDADYEYTMLDQKVPSIGIELWGNSVAILDGDTRPLGPNEKGEIAISGFNVMKSYLGSAEPLHYLRTGDMGYYIVYNTKKYFFIEGRIKDSAKRMGETIALRDLDEQIGALDLNFDMITVAFPHSHSGEEIGLLCCSEKLTDEVWQKFKAQLLLIPYYKRPKIILFIAHAVLRTSSGKPLRWKHVEKFKTFSQVTFSKKDIVTG